MKTLIYFRLLLPVFLLLIVSNSVKADNYYFEQAPMQDGTFATVSCVYAEKNGFVWVGTSMAWEDLTGVS